MRAIGAASNAGQLRDLLADAAKHIGCLYFALTQHVDLRGGASDLIPLHNYPADWSRWFIAHRLATRDPVHRACRRTAAGFLWREVPKLLALTADDHMVFERARRMGLGDGLTIPANVPGEPGGSVSFATAVGGLLPDLAMPFAQSIGVFAFERARKLHRVCPSDAAARLTDRQRECILWVARGKTDWEIAQILGVSPVTVIEHLRNARARYGVPSRAVLPVRALFDGALTFDDIFAR